jgi:HEAT repeat protein
MLACAEALGKLAEPGTGAALAAVVTGPGPALLRAAALTALAKTGHPAVTVTALAAGEDFDPGVRDHAVRILARHGGREATARLLAFCDGPLAPAALRGLIRIGDQRALPLLRRIFLTTQDRGLRHLAGRAIVRSLGDANRLSFYTGPLSAPAQARAIAWVLGETGDTGYSRQLRELLKHRDELTRARAAAALGKISPCDAGTPAALRAALTDISPRVRASAATALGRLPVTEVIGWLQPYRRDPHPAVRTAAEAVILKQQLAPCGTAERLASRSTRGTAGSTARSRFEPSDVRSPWLGRERGNRLIVYGSAADVGRSV